MSGLQDIPVQVEEGVGDAPTAQVLAIASEIEQLLKTYLEDGRAGSIDLRSLPMAPGDYQALNELLGVGEVMARLDALGASEIYETAVPGVWWLKHRNSSDELMADLIEITDCPDILKTQQEDLRESPERLRARMDQAEIRQ